MPVILFIMFPFRSHFTTTFGYAHDWKNRGFRVIFIGGNYNKSIVEQEGFEFGEVYYFVEPVITSFKVFFAYFIKSCLDKNSIKTRYKVWLRCVYSVKEIVDYYNPAAIFIDNHISYFYFFVSSKCKNIAILNTKLSTQKAKNTPPLNSSFVAKNTLMSFFICEFIWVNHLLCRRLKEFVSQVAFCGYNQAYFLKKNQKRVNINYLIDKKNGLFNSIKNIPRVIIGLKALEFSFRPQLKNEFYINFFQFRNENQNLSEEYLSLKNKLIDLKKNQNKKIIYVSFGTISKDYTNRLLIFYPKLIKSVQQNKDFVLIISSTNEQLSFDFSKSSNIFTMPFIPQLDMLKIADVMITHGGMGSIKECIQENVPMLVYPLNLKQDQPGNAARVQSKGWGIKGDMLKDSTKDIFTKLMQVMTINYDGADLLTQMPKEFVFTDEFNLS